VLRGANTVKLTTFKGASVIHCVDSSRDKVVSDPFLDDGQACMYACFRNFVHYLFDSSIITETGTRQGFF